MKKLFKILDFDDKVREYIEKASEVKFLNQVLRYLIGQDAPNNIISYFYESYAYSKTLIKDEFQRKKYALKKTIDFISENKNLFFKNFNGNKKYLVFIL